jgi:hypothetical protein
MKYNLLKIFILLLLSSCENDAKEKKSNALQKTEESLRIANCDFPKGSYKAQTFFFHNKILKSCFVEEEKE